MSESPHAIEEIESGATCAEHDLSAASVGALFTISSALRATSIEVDVIRVGRRQ